MTIATFNYMYCRNGHMLYSRHQINQKRCQQCGEPFVLFCEKCNARLKSTFSSHVYMTSGKPISGPHRPDNCGECGEPFPWAGISVKSKSGGLWDCLHPKVVKVAQKRFEDGHFADAVEASLKLLNQTVKKIVRDRTGQEYDGSALMRSAFSPKNPIIILDDLSSESGRNIQQGYMEIFAGAMTGIRNPKAHDVITIDDTRAIHHLFLASLLFSILDEAQ